MNQIFYLNVLKSQHAFVLLFSVLLFSSCKQREKITEGNIIAQVIERPVKNDIKADSGIMVTATEMTDSVTKPAVKVKKESPAPMVKPKPKSMPPPVAPKSMPPQSMPPPKTSASPSGGSSEPKEFQGMSAPQPNEEIEFVPEAPKGIRNPVGPNKNNVSKKQKPK